MSFLLLASSTRHWRAALGSGSFSERVDPPADGVRGPQTAAATQMKFGFRSSLQQESCENAVGCCQGSRKLFPSVLPVRILERTIIKPPRRCTTSMDHRLSGPSFLLRDMHTLGAICRSNTSLETSMGQLNTFRQLAEE